MQAQSPLHERNGLARQPLAAPAKITIAPPPVTQPSLVQSDRVVALGQTVEGRPINMHIFGDPAVGSSNTILILGGIHGNEPTSAGVARELLAYLRNNPQFFTGRCVAIIPEANPDGLARRLRTNKNLVDLNRNFPSANWKKTRKSSFFGGDAPASQPETNALIHCVKTVHPGRIVSIHSMDDPCNNYDGPAEPLARLMALSNGYPVKSNIGYPTPGSFGSWAGTDQHIPLITLELPNHGTTPKSWEKNRGALLGFICAAPVDLGQAMGLPAPATSHLAASEQPGN